MLEKNTPDGLRPGPVDDPRIEGLDKRVIRKRAPRRVRRHLVCKSLDEELLVRLSLTSGGNLARLVQEKRNPRPCVYSGVGWLEGGAGRSRASSAPRLAARPGG